MGQHSRLERLPPQLKDRLHALLADPHVTQQEIADALNAEAGEPVTSQSGVSRYAQTMRRFAAENRQATQIVQAWVKQVGAEGQQDLGEAIIHQLRHHIFDLQVRIQEYRESADVDSEATERIAELLHRAARTVASAELAAARSINSRRRIEERTRKQAAAAAESEAKAAGLSDEMVDALRTRILGVAG